MRGIPSSGNNEERAESTLLTSLSPHWPLKGPLPTALQTTPGRAVPLYFSPMHSILAERLQLDIVSTSLARKQSFNAYGGHAWCCGHDNNGQHFPVELVFATNPPTHATKLRCMCFMRANSTKSIPKLAPYRWQEVHHKILFASEHCWALFDLPAHGWWACEG